MTNVVVEVAAVAKTLNTDYTVDAARGHIVIVAGGGSATGATIDVESDITPNSYDGSVAAGAAVQTARS